MTSAFVMVGAYQEDEVRTYLTNLGFEKIETHHYLEAMRKETDHLVAYSFGYKDILDNGRKARVYAVIVRGTRGENEWISNVTVGTGVDAFGFSSAADECMQAFMKYMKIYPAQDGATSRIWFAAHSRGSAVSNLMAARMIRNGTFRESNVHAYLFACPRVTTEENPLQTMAIKSFNFSEDIVTRLPPIEWGFTNHGVNYVYQTANHDEGLARLNLLLQYLLRLAPNQETLDHVLKALLSVEVIELAEKVACGTFDASEVDWVEVAAQGSLILLALPYEVTAAAMLKIQDTLRQDDLADVYRNYAPYANCHSSGVYLFETRQRMLEKQGEEWCNDIYKILHGLD